MKHNQKVGQFGENLACEYLIKKGYKIIQKNVKISFQEIDIIAKLEKLIVFVEVKTRTSNIYGEADETVYEKKTENLKKAIEKYVFINNLNPELTRLDLVAIDINRDKKIAKIKHYLDII